MPRCCMPLSGLGRQTTDCTRDVGRVCGSCTPLLRLWHGSRTAGANRLLHQATSALVRPAACSRRPRPLRQWQPIGAEVLFQGWRPPTCLPIYKLIIYFILLILSFFIHSFCLNGFLFWSYSTLGQIPQKKIFVDNCRKSFTGWTLFPSIIQQ